MFFDHIYVVTCDTFYDRQLHVINQFKKHKLPFRFIYPVDANTLTSTGTVSKYSKSLTTGHMRAIEHARDNDFSQILICEDDVEFIDNFCEELDIFVNNIPSDWSYLQLGNQFWATQWLQRDKISNNLYKFKWGTGSHCVGIHRTVFYETLLRMNKFTHPTDITYYFLFKRFSCYCPEKFLADALSKQEDWDYISDKHIFDSTIEHRKFYA